MLWACEVKYRRHACPKPLTKITNGKDPAPAWRGLNFGAGLLAEPVSQKLLTAAIEGLTPSTATGDWHRVATGLFGLAAGPQVVASQAIEVLLAELREAVVRPSIAQLLWRRLTPLSVREALYRWLTERPRN